MPAQADQRASRYAIFSAMASALSTSDRQLWADTAKGMAILLVVICHCGNGLAARMPLLNLEAWRVFSDLCYTFMVPVFFFVSGWFCQQSRKGAEARVWVLLANLLYPCFIWMTLQGALLYYQNDRGQSVAQWVHQYVVYGPMQFWFFETLLLILLLDLLWRRLAVPYLVRLAVAIGFYALHLAYSPQRVIGDVLAIALFFELGGLLSKGRWPVVSGWVRGSIAAVGACGVGWLYDAKGWPYLAASLSGVAACLMLASLIRGRAALWLQTLGRYSLAIFCAHLIFSGGVRLVLGRLGVTHFGGQLLIGCLAGVLGPLILALLDQRIGGWLFSYPGGREKSKVRVSLEHPLVTTPEDHQLPR